MGPTTRERTVLGFLPVIAARREGIRVATHQAATELLDVFQEHGHSEIDTARVYGGGTTEEYLGAIGWQECNIKMETKGMGWLLLKTSRIRLQTSAKLSRTVSRRSKPTNYTCSTSTGPTAPSPSRDTLREVNNIYTEGVFERFGLSNFQSWEVAQICEICKRNGWVMPTVYQGLYNAQHRLVEAELFPCLRAYGISFYVFNPLAGGFLTSRYTRDQAAFNDGERFDPSRKQGQLHRMRYWNEPNFKALDLLRPAIAPHGITESEAALRWLAHIRCSRMSLATP
ncbi:NADP-dependent oxidoreductase domain-containing protein [Mycena polygramma]|nr:NADP-dependent oxidoreductase domain-containing protein [Mycena polygramma]